MTGPIVGSEWMVGALADRPPAGQEVRLFIDAATGNATYSDGAGWHSFGGGSMGTPLPGTELAYAAITADFVVADLVADALISGLSFTLTVPVGVKYCLEIFCKQVNEDSGSTDGDVFTLYVQDEALFQYVGGNVANVSGGYGSALYARGATVVGDGLPHTYSAKVAWGHNGTGGAGTDGVIVAATSAFPAFIRAVAV